MTIKFIFLFLAFRFGFLPAVAGDLETNILSFPKIDYGNYRPDKAIDSANELISAGKEIACASLKKIAQTNTNLNDSRQINENVCFLCRLLFISTNANQHLRPPKIGEAKLMSASLSPSIWPDLPFVVISNMPLSIISGYASGGLSERAQDYLDYCKSYGSFRAKLFSKSSGFAVSNAFDKIFSSPEWRAMPWISIAQAAQTNLSVEQASNVVEYYIQNKLKQEGKIQP